jgi:HD superfamily phosphohydrolase
MIDAISGERIVRLVESKLDFDDDGKMLANNIDLSPLYSSIITGFPIDADRMDYLLRDGTFTGVRYGVYDLSRLFTSLIPVQQGNSGYLAIKESGVDACVRFIESRTHLFNIVYPHKTNISASKMLDFVFEGFAGSVIKASTYEELVEFYWQNSDEFFIRHTIKDVVINSIGDKTEKEKKVETLEQLLRRRMWKKVFEYRFTVKTDTSDREKEFKEKEKTLKQLVASINTKLQSLRDITSRADLFINRVFKDYEKSNLFIVKKNVGMYKLEKTWKGFNSEVAAMDYKVGFFKIFMSRSFNSSKEFNKQQKNVLELVDEEISQLKKLTE